MPSSLATALNPDLALIDIRMPELDGFELMTLLKTQLPELDIILMTGSVDDLDEKLARALRSPAFYFIQKPFDRDVLSALVERCLELRWRREQHRQTVDRLEKEVAEAHAFQQSLLPEREKVVNGVAICCRYTPWARLGGDLYDYAAVESGQTALLIADVSGHGVSAAMLTGVVKSAFHASRADGFDPLAVVHRVWRSLSAFSAERFVTLFAALVARDERQLRYASAGHPSIPLWSGTGLPYGWRDRAAYLARAARVRVGSAGDAGSTRAISSCCSPMASQTRSPMPRAAQRRESRRRLKRTPPAARSCWMRSSQPCSTNSLDARHRTISRC